ncbi:substrate-binding periplasmic protein [Ferrovibrio xuzhouensis]|uniref:Substrate-binding periplasmic protein n=1 Tax=Ferrovibrio xuzhouensis TaxID=1576914 RepID=A0ABV7VGF3_9PROT
MLCLALLPQRLLAADGPVLQVLLNDAPPYRIIDDSTRPPRYSGIYVDIARTAAARAGVRLDFMQVPYARAFAMMQNGEGDLMLGPNRTPEREAYLLYLDPALPAEPKVFVVRQNGPVIARRDDLRGLRIATLRGAHYTADFDGDAALVRVPVVDYETALRMLGGGRVETAIMPEMRARWLLREQPGLRLAGYRIPYVFAQYTLAGKVRAGFSSWIEQFCGTYKPAEDIAEFLYDQFGIEVRSPDAPENLSPDLTSEIREYWRRVQDRRRGSRDDFGMMANRLAEHDSETCLTVLEQRKLGVGKSPLGYTSWWFTLDSAAWRMQSDIDPAVWLEIKHSPVISIDFLLKYLTFGPNRDQVAHSERSLASMLSGVILESLPNDLLEIVNKIRQESEGVSERVVQRRIRDAVDREKSKIGPVHMAGLDGANQSINDMF